MHRAAVILSGCGFLDGSEIHESVLLLLALETVGIKPVCFAPNKMQTRTMNHVTKTSSQQERNILEESARIARSQIHDLSTLNLLDYDAIAFPGGLGAAFNLSNYGIDSANTTVDPQIEAIILKCIEIQKPMLAACIAPMLIAKTCARHQIRCQITLGSSPSRKEELEKMNIQSISCSIDNYAADPNYKIISTPCYLEPADLPKMWEGMRKSAEHLKKWL